MGPSETFSRTEMTFKVLVTLATSILLLYAITQIISMFYSIVVLLALAMVLTYILLVPVGWVERFIVFCSNKAHQWKHFSHIARHTPEVNPRILAVILVYFSFFVIASIGTMVLFPVLTHQLNEFGKALPRYVSETENRVMEWSNDVLGEDIVKKLFESDIEKASQQGVIPLQTSDDQPSQMTAAERELIQTSVLRSALTHAFEFLEHAASTAIENLVGLVTQTLNGLIYFLTGLVLVYFFLLDGKKIGKGILAMLPERYHLTATYFLDSFHQVMFNFVKGQVLLAILSGLFMFLLYSIFHVKYAIFLSSFFTIAEILPVIGPWIAFTPGILVILFSEHPEHAFYIWFIYVLIKDNFILPKVVGDVMGLHPVIVIFSIFICAKVGGVMGVVLALPIASVLNVMLRYYFNPPTSPPTVQLDRSLL